MVSVIWVLSADFALFPMLTATILDKHAGHNPVTLTDQAPATPFARQHGSRCWSALCCEGQWMAHTQHCPTQCAGCCK